MAEIGGFMVNIWRVYGEHLAVFMRDMGGFMAMFVDVEIYGMLR